MRDRWRGLPTWIVGLIALLIGAGPSFAQEATPAAPGLSVVASGLTYPRGFTWDANGDLFVALAGNGENQVEPGVPSADAAAPTVPAVVRIEGGCGVPVAVGLPSTRDPYGDRQGPTAVGFLDGELYVLQDATGTLEDVGRDFPNGLYAVNAEGGVRLVADVTAYANANQPANVYHLLPLGEPFAMVAGDDEFWAVDANRGELLRLTTDGGVERFADLSLNHPVPTAIALAPDGGLYVGFLGASPHTDGTSKIVKVTA
ncbi:MAG: ScyD/ScyE family protein, partial [Chloroflexia bacterium]|nr:ScyD/ScyE family protein [Chloroflexia bacterium]